MDRAALGACLPWLALLLVLAGIACILARLGGARLDPRRLLRLHADQHGAAQSLSFVITLPLFVMILLSIVQVTQLMIGAIVVHYAAYAAARAAVVWIPARTASELENCVSGGRTFGDGYVPPYSDTDHAFNAGPDSSTGATYSISSGGSKYHRIQTAAQLACLPICPSKGYGVGSSDSTALQPLVTAYRALAPQGSGAIDERLANKLAWTTAATEIDVTFYHNNQEPPLRPYIQTDHPYSDDVEFHENEIGWQDLITVKVSHRLCLLPGPFAFMAGLLKQSKVSQIGSANSYLLEAEATLGNEGLKSVEPFDESL